MGEHGQPCSSPHLTMVDHGHFKYTMVNHALAWVSMVSHGHHLTWPWSLQVYHGQPCFSMCEHGQPWSSPHLTMVDHGYFKYTMVNHALAWLSMVSHGHHLSQLIDWETGLIAYGLWIALLDSMAEKLWLWSKTCAANAPKQVIEEWRKQTTAIKGQLSILINYWLWYRASTEV